MHCGYRIQVKLILAVMKQLKQLQRKPRKYLEALALLKLLRFYFVFCHLFRGKLEI